MPNMRTLLMSLILFSAGTIAFLLFAARSSQPMLLQHGNPEVPQGNAYAIMNPFRNRRPEEIAEELMSDLRTSRCEQILRSLHSDDSRICTTMKGNTSARLLWREDGN